MKPPPILLLAPTILPPSPISRHHNNRELRVRKRRPALVEEVIDAELDPGADDPAEGAEMVVGDVREEEGVGRGEAGRGERGEIGVSAEEGEEVGV